jgi:hypothetical protein
MKAKQLFILILLLSFSVRAQSVSLSWQKCYGGTSSDYASMIVATSDGGSIKVGEVLSNNGDVIGNHGDSDTWVVKSDVNGNVLWKRCLGGTLGEYSSKICQANNGGYLVVFSSESSNGDLLINYGSVDICLAKLDNNGLVEWIHSYGGSGTEYTGGVVSTSDGGFVILGASDSNDGDVSGNNGGGDTWVFKVDSFGQMIWQHCYGGLSGDGMRDIQLTNDGGFILVGSTNSNTGMFASNHGNNDYWVLKLTSSGALEWSKCFGGSIDEHGYSIKQTIDNGYILIGSTQSNDGNVSGNHSFQQADLWVVKINEFGNMLWQKCYGGTAQDWGYNVVLNTNNGYFISGTVQSNNGDIIGSNGSADYWVAEIDSIGGIIHSYCFGGSSVENLKNIDKTLDGKLIILGNTVSTNGDVSGNHGQTDLWVVKFCFPKVKQIYATAVDSILINGVTYTQSGFYVDTLANLNSCDSIFYINLDISYTGLNENNFNDISIYPNPASELLCIEVANLGSYKNYFLFDINGNQILTGTIEEVKSYINVSKLSKGIYFLKMDNQFEKVIIE